MKFPQSSEIRSEKLAELSERISRLKIDIASIEESFSAGGGKGGQKINRCRNKVTLKYPGLGLIVQCQTERKLSLNRFMALRELADKIEMLISPGTSKRLAEMEKIRKNKDRSKKEITAGRIIQDTSLP